MKKLILIIGVTIAAIVTLALITPPNWASVERRIASAYPDVPSVSAEEANRRMLAAHLLLDARSSEEWQLSHLPGAVRAEDLATAETAIARHGRLPIIIYCAVGLRSARLASELIAAGHDQVVNLRGGIFNWAAEQRPMIDADGDKSFEVHPYNWYWGQLREQPLSPPATPPARN